MRSIIARITALVTALALAPSAPAIVGGTEAAPGSWPWAAAISWVVPGGLVGPADGTSDVLQVCTGSLIGERWVLTASHCVLDEGRVIGSPGAFLQGTTFRIVIGQADLRNPSPENVYTADWTDVRSVDPGNLLALKGDIAVIRLDRPASQPAIRIPGAGQAADAAALTTPGRSSTVVGWGLTDENAPAVSDVLRQVDVPIVSDGECHAAYPTIDFFGIVFGFDPTTMICAGLPEGRKDSCQGDSGGPLMAAQADGNWVQIGVTSWGTGCGRAGLPGVYARLSGLYGFIVQNVANDPEAPAGTPQVSGGTATAVGKRKATISAMVLPNGFATDYVVEVGVNRRYRTATIRGYAGAGGAQQAISSALTGLKPGTTYHYRVTAVNVAGVVRSPDLTFTTKLLARGK